MKPLKAVLISVLLLVALHIPYVGQFLRAFNTMIHESGHAIMTLITSGKVESISLFANTEGVTESYLSSWFASVLVSFSGYIFSSLVLLTFALLWKRQYHKTILLIFGLLAVVNLVLWVRNLYGIMWLVLFISSIVLLFKTKQKTILPYVTLGLLIILCTDAFRASFDILYLSYQDGTQAGDATNLANKTFIPAIVWGSFFFIQNLIFTYFSIRQLFKKRA